MTEYRRAPFAGSLNEAHTPSSSAPTTSYAAAAAARRSQPGANRMPNSGLGSVSSAPSLLERRGSSPAGAHDEADAHGDENDADSVATTHTRQASFPTTRESMAAPTMAMQDAVGYFVPRPPNSKSVHASPQVDTTFTPPPNSRGWSYGSGWSWQSAEKPSMSCRHVVTGTNGAGVAAPLVGIAKSPEITGRFAIAGRTTLKVMQVSTTDSISPNTPARVDVQVVEELKDQARMGKSYGVRDVAWGYGLNSRRIATGCANGVAVLYDLESSRRQEQIKYDHDRAINRIVFGGQSGGWLISAAQDSFCKLWDVRTDSVAILSMMTSSDPARDIACHPSLAVPSIYSICTVHDSGALLRWDIRHCKAPRERLQAHTGGALCLAWKSGISSETGGGEEGESWLATGGQDRTVKVWRLTSGCLPTKPTHTIYPAVPVSRIAWRPGFGTELATISLPPIGQTGEGDPQSGTTATSEVEIWDVRRPYLAKLALRHPLDGVASSLLFPDASTLWTCHRTTSTFIQHDVDHDAVRQDEDLPRCAVGWNIEGELAFAASARETDFAEHRDAPPGELGGEGFDVEQELATVVLGELDFDGPTFRRLAEGYVVEDRPFEELCAVNADLAESNDRLDASQTWRILARWFGEPETLPPPPSKEVPPVTPQYYQPSLKQTLSGRTTGRHSFSPQGSPSRVPPPPSRLGLVSQTFPASLSLSEASTHREEDEDGSSSSANESHARLTSYSSRPSDRPPLSSTDTSESDEQAGDITPSPLVLPSALPPQYQQHSRNSSKSSNSLTTPRATRSTFLGSARSLAEHSDDGAATPMHRSLSTSSDSEAEGPYGSVRSAAHQLKMHRRALSDGPAHLPTLASTSAAASRIAARSSRSRTRRGPGLALSRATTSTLGDLPTRTVLGGGTLTTTPTTSSTAKSTLKQQAAQSRQAREWEVLREELRTKLQQGLREVLDRYAEQGDVQMCVTVMAVMRGKMDFDVAFRVRATASYLKLLHRFSLFVPAAGIRRCSEDEALRLKSTDSTTIYTACGRCRKALAQTPYGLCKRCSAPVVRCTLCHRAIRENMLGICSSCGHGVHRECISAYLRPGGQSGIHSNMPSRSSLATTPATSAPSTPRFFFGEWLWGPDDPTGGSSGTETTPIGDDGGATITQAPSLQNSPRNLSAMTAFLPMPRELSEALVCPSGCGCRPCAIFELPEAEPSTVLVQ